ncbi:MAG: hypothetical protein Q8R24_05265 [Legionellaceae bacterium]|nr:hypothetical protein [Legionellaceae bacterium]
MKQETIDMLISMAVAAYTKKSSPGEYARAAAHKAAFRVASQHSPELADFAALLAAATYFIEIMESINFTARVTDAAATKLAADSAYDAEWESYTLTTLPQHVATKNFFLSLAQGPEKVIQAFSGAVAPAYDSTRVLDVVARNKAKRAALYVYRDTYCAARTAYMRALFSANQTPNIDRRLNQFTSVITSRLQKDLTYDLIIPGFLLSIMSSRALMVIASLILLAGIGAILLASFHVTPLPFVPLIAAGSASIAFGTGLLAGRFFAKNRCETINEANENRAEMSIVS